jgi:hypothetical protein
MEKLKIPADIKGDSNLCKYMTDITIELHKQKIINLVTVREYVDSDGRKHVSMVARGNVVGPNIPYLGQFKLDKLVTGCMSFPDTKSNNRGNK